MTVVIGTAGHIDHGKTTLLQALTGIDADRLPEERRRGMTIDVGYAHLTLDDGSELDFVDVPGHDKLVGNMLVGAGEIDAALLVVAADDGPRAQTLEHLALLDALGIRHGLAVVTKIDAVDAERASEVAAAVGRMLQGTSLAGVRIVAVSATRGTGLDALRAALIAVRDAVEAARPDGSARAAGATAGAGARTRLAIDRVFSVKGRGTVVTGTVRGGTLDRGATLRLVPGGTTVRVREIQVHNATAPSAGPGRTALNLAAVESESLHRGQVLTDDARVLASSRVLVRLGLPLADRARARLHLGTAATDAAISRSGRDAVDLADGFATAILRLAEPVAVAAGDPFVLRRASGSPAVVGGRVLDVDPPRGLSRRRGTTDRLTATSAAIDAGDDTAIDAARLERHGVLVEHGRVRLAADVHAAASTAALAAVAPEASSSAVRLAVAKAIRRLATLRRDDTAAAAALVIDELVGAGRLVRDGDILRLPGARPTPPDPAVAAAMDRLERALAIASPPPLSQAAREAGCPPAHARDLERAGRIVVLGPDLAYAMSTYRDLAATALGLARTSPLTPAAFRDATGTSRKFVMAILEDLDRRGVLRRTDAGHVPGPKAPAMAGVADPDPQARG